jgi:hypothetical protein
MERPKLNLRPGPDAALIFMKGNWNITTDQKESGGKVGMADYRVHTIGVDGNFINSRAFSCDNDPDAIEWAKQLVDGHDIELRSGARLVIRLERKPK